MRTERVERLLKLIQALQTGRSFLVDELASLVGVSRRTVFRDLRLLEQAGMPYHYDRGSRRYSIEQTSVLPPVALTPGEALALLLAIRQHQASHIEPDTAAASSAALKLESMLPRALQDYCQPRLRHIEFRPDPASDATSIADMLGILQVALARSRKVGVRYDSYHEGREIEVTLRPYRLVFMHRGWYLVAYTEEQARVQTYKVERILQIKPLNDRYSMDPKFSVDEYFGNAWLMIRGEHSYHVVVRFRPQVAGNVDEVIWHRTQQTHHDTDGSLLFEVDVDGLDEILWWILGYGDQAQVLEPPELRQRVAGHAHRLAAYYADEPPNGAAGAAPARDF